ncbi:MAG: hypothetical protein JKX70_08125 [Phycisphaerales bacterium]|nr:hypothetical protein [Phycisphaerales bacterium]
MDRINSASSAGSFPINQALRAYAQSPRMNRPGGAPFAKSVQPMRPVAPTAPTTSTTSVEPTQRPQRTDAIGKIAPKQSVLQSSSIGDLVGGKVQAIDLTNDIAQITGPKPVMTSAGTYNMYPQAADRNLAATGVQANRPAANVALGRSLDLNG